MKDVIQYIIETLICGGLFMLLYRAVIARRASFGFARGYLIVATLLSAVIPLMRIPVYPAVTAQLTIPLINMGAITV